MGKKAGAREKIGVSALKDVAVLYEGDIYELACLSLKAHDAKDKGTGTLSRRTVNGLLGDYAMLAGLSREQVLEMFERHNLPLGATVEYDNDVPLTDNASKKDSPLKEITSRAIEIGASELEIEYKDGYEEVFAMKGGQGFGIAKLNSSTEEAALLRDELYVIGKRKSGRIRIAGAKYTVKVEIFDSFGEDAFRVTLEKIEQKA